MVQPFPAVCVTGRLEREGEPEPLQQLLERMAESGFLWGNDTGYQLLAKGKTEVTHLLAAAKAHETDVLGQFSLDESRQLKALLARMV